MKTEDFEKLGISRELAEKCASAVEQELSGFVPKARLDEVISARDFEKAQRETIEKKLREIQNSNSNADSLKAEIDKLRADQKAEREKFSAETAKLKIDMAVERELTASGAKSIRIAKAAMADFFREAKLNDDGTVDGLSDFVSKMKSDKESAFLFNETATAATAKKAAPKGGYTPPAGTGAGAPKQPTWQSAIAAKLNHE